MSSDRDNEVRRLIAETAALRERSKAAIQDSIKTRREAREAWETTKQLHQAQSELARELIHIAKNVQFALALRFGQPQNVHDSLCWVVAREGMSPLTVHLNNYTQPPASVWVFDPHCNGDDRIESQQLKSNDDAAASMHLVQKHLAKAS